MLGLGGDPHLPQFLVQLLHEAGDPGLDHAEVVVLHFLAPGGRRAEEGPSGQPQVPTGVV